MGTSNNFLDVMVGVTTSVGPVMILFLMLLIWAYVFTRLIEDGVGTAGMISSLLTTVVGFLFFLLGVFEWTYLLIPIFMI